MRRCARRFGLCLEEELPIHEIRCIVYRLPRIVPRAARCARLYYVAQMKKERTLTCFSDARAAKVGEIREHGHVQWLFYHPRKQIQLRISGPAAVHTDDRVADACWAQVNGFSRPQLLHRTSPGYANRPALIRFACPAGPAAVSSDAFRCGPLEFCRYCRDSG